MGLWLDLSELGPSHRGAGQLATPLQLAPAPRRHRRCRTDVQTQTVRTQRLDASQLVGSRICRPGAAELVLRQPSVVIGVVLLERRVEPLEALDVVLGHEALR